MKELISVAEARALIDQSLAQRESSPDVERVRLMESSGRTLAADLYSPSDQPAFANSAMDGYAVAPGGDGSDRHFRVVGESRAGVPFGRTLTAGEAIRISTGAVVPEGSEAVVPVELVERATEDTVYFRDMTAPGAHIRLPGKDVRRGELVFRRGTRIKGRSLPLLATMGVASVPVYSKPRLAIITTGDELVDVATPDPLPPGMIRDSNAVALATLSEAVGAVVVSIDRAADTPADLGRALGSAASADIVVLSGGISVGPHDHARTVLQDEGVSLAFWRVRQRPGKPIAFGTAGDRLLFALPGNPVSSAICFDQYVRRAVQRLLAQDEDPTRTATAFLEERLDVKQELYHFIRGATRIDDQARLWVRPTGAQDSNLISSVVRADCVIHVEEGAGALGSGQPVPIEWLPY